MTLDIYPQNFGVLPETHPYASTLSSSASSSTSSVFSDAASQASSQSSLSSHSSWESEEWSRVQVAPTAVDPLSLAAFQPINRVSTYPQYQPSACRETVQERLPSLRAELLAPVDQRQNPRRSSSTIHQRAPPQLVRQSDRKVNFVDCLVDSATQMVEVIWQLSEPKSRCETASGRGVLPLRTFIQETLRRSRTSYSTLQVALYYLILIKAHLPKHDFTMSQPEDASLRALQCGRRMFLAALILASKYLQDRNYSARAWSKISGLKVCEINTNEMAFLEAVNWKLHIVDAVWEKWQEVVLRHTPTNPPASPGASIPNTWKDVIPVLTPELNIVELAPKAPLTPVRPQLLRSQPSMKSLRYTSQDGYGSQESTPTPSRCQVPRFLEPKPEMLPPTPSLPSLTRLNPLPTPFLTPQSITSNTPAASVVAFGSRRPSMCSAMAQAQCSSLARTCVDQFNPSIRNGLEAYHFPSRRPSLALSQSSLSSSPESMISDHSRSSRASSISSISSAGWAPNQSQAKLARLATCRSARLPYPALSKCKEQYEYAPSEAMSSPDLESFHLDDSDASPRKSESPVSVRSVSRKRGRSSVDLQQNVRHLLHSTRSAFSLRGPQTVLPDRSLALSFTSGVPMGLQSPKHIVPDYSRLPIQKDFGKKRACCGTEAAQGFLTQGPGMWEGIL
ncbi:PHO85 cyclin-5 [Coniothyrium glycines]